MKGYFPLGSYSKPLAKKIGLEAAVLLFELIKDQGEASFRLSDGYVRELGIETYSWALEKLVKSEIFSHDGELFYINYEILDKFLSNNENIRTEEMSKPCLDACKKWIKFLYVKKGVNKDLGAFLNEMDGKDELEVISSINKSISNNWKTLYFNEKTFKDKPEKGGWNL